MNCSNCVCPLLLDPCGPPICCYCLCKLFFLFSTTLILLTLSISVFSKPFTCTVTVRCVNTILFGLGALKAFNISYSPLFGCNNAFNSFCSWINLLFESSIICIIVEHMIVFLVALLIELGIIVVRTTFIIFVIINPQYCVHCYHHVEETIIFLFCSLE